MEARKDNGFTVLHNAAGFKQLKVVELLIESGADKEAKGDDGATTLHLASEEGQVDMVHYLISQGAEIEAKANGGYTPLHTATIFNHLNLVELLIQHGADQEAKTGDGCTALHLASEAGHVDIVQYLIGQGGKIDAKMNNGFTVLHKAAWFERLKVVHVLLLRLAQTPGVDWNNHRDKDGVSTIELLGKRRFTSSTWVVLQQMFGINETCPADYEAILAGKVAEIATDGLAIADGINGTDNDCIKVLGNETKWPRAHL